MLSVKEARELKKIEKKEESFFFFFSFFIFLIFGAISIFVYYFNNTSLNIISETKGIVVPSSKVKVIQHLEGGIIKKIYANIGDIVKKNDILLELEPVKTLADFSEIEKRITTLSINILRLRAESDNKKLIQITDNYKELRKIINDTFSGLRLDKLNYMYDDLEDRMVVAPASSVEHYHNSKVGGYVEHILHVVKFSLKISLKLFIISFSLISGKPLNEILIFLFIELSLSLILNDIKAIPSNEYLRLSLIKEDSESYKFLPSTINFPVSNFSTIFGSPGAILRHFPFSKIFVKGTWDELDSCLCASKCIGSPCTGIEI